MEQRKKGIQVSPEYLAREQRIKTLARIVSFMCYPSSPLRQRGVRQSGRRLVQLKPPDSTAAPIEDKDYFAYLEHIRPDSDHVAENGYPENIDYLAYQALFKYCFRFRKNPQNKSQEKDNLLDIDSDSNRLIDDVCEKSKWPYKLGAALYLHQQMVVHNKCKEPSQSKALWLAAKAPLKFVDVGNGIELRPDGGDSGKIGDRWASYYSVAHFWAAFVVWTKSPLVFPDTNHPLLDFICSAEVDHFLADAALFRAFREQVKTPRTKNAFPFIKQFEEREDDVLSDVVPSPTGSIPDLLENYQWEALEQYATRKRKKLNRSD